MSRFFSFALAALCLLAAMWLFAPAGLSSAAGEVVIGNGTAASCESADAANEFSAAFAAGGVISFDCGPAPVTIFVNTNLTDTTVTVNGGGLVTLSGEDLRQIFYLNSSANVTLNDLILLDGEAAQGGAIYIDSGAVVTINGGFITSNHAADDGGAIHNQGTLTINGTMIGSNIAGANGGAIFNNGGTVALYDAYLISNQAQSGGGVFTINGLLTLERTAVRSNFITSTTVVIILVSLFPSQRGDDTNGREAAEQQQ